MGPRRNSNREDLGIRSLVLLYGTRRLGRGHFGTGSQGVLPRRNDELKQIFLGVTIRNTLNMSTRRSGQSI